MSKSNKSTLALFLDAPFQSYGTKDRFAHRTTAPHPSKSAVAGMGCAALGLAKGLAPEATFLQEFNRCCFTTVEVNRKNSQPGVLRDYHTVSGTVSAEGNPKNTVQTYRYYLMDSRFVVLIQGPSKFLQALKDALENPRWGIWFGRKSCIPASPIVMGLYSTVTDAWRGVCARIGANPDVERSITVDAIHSDQAGIVDVAQDAADAFGQPGSSSEGRRYHPRRVLQYSGVPGYANSGKASS